MNTQDWHWLGRCWQPMSMLASVLLLWALTQRAREWLRRRQRAAQVAVADPPASELRFEGAAGWWFGALGAVVLLWAAHYQYAYAVQMAPAHTYAPGVQQTLQELDRRTEQDSVVLCLDATILAMIPVYTHCNVYLPYCIMSCTPTYELIDRASITLSTFGVPRGRIHRLLRTQKERNWGDVELFRENDIDWGNWLFHQLLPYSGAPPEAEREIAARTAFYGPQAALENLKRYRVDFVLWGPAERRMGDPALERAWTDRLFIDAGEVKVYRVAAPEVQQWKPSQ